MTVRVLSGDVRLLAIGGLSLVFVLFGLAVSGPAATAEGLADILLARDTLITDYVELGGVGAAFVNAGVLTLISCGIYRLSGAAIGGAAVACLLLVLGFALFGKNLLNVWPILGGVWLYARFRRDRFADHINTAFFGCALAPVTSEILFSSALTPASSIPLGIATGLAMGFIMPPVAAGLFRAHQGYSLYNMGFAAGVIGSVVVAIYMSYGFVPVPVFIWATDQTGLLAPFLLACFAAMIVAGRAIEPDGMGRFLTLQHEAGRSPSDFLASAGDGGVLINMGGLGVLSTAYVLAIGGDMNGPVIGAILSVVGFGAFGKHPANCVPLVAGVYLSSVLSGADPTSAGMVLAALFSTTLAPISGSFGWYWGLVAGLIHASVAQSVGVLHGGLNLYNNGFAAGIVAALLAPVILTLRSGRSDNSDNSPEKI